MAQEFEKLESLADQLKEYTNTRLAQLKLTVAERISKVAAFMIAFVVVALVFFLFFVLLCGAAALVIGEWLHNVWLGFLIMAGIVLLIGFILWYSKDRWLRKPIMNMLIEAMFDKEADDEED
jgi:drug/metabolite transporter (DMT)-like permease